MKIYVIMCGNKEEAKRIQQENWTALGRMGIALRVDLNSSSIDIAGEIRLLHLMPSDLEGLYGLKIEDFRTYGTFCTAKNSRKILNRLELCKRR